MAGMHPLWRAPDRIPRGQLPRINHSTGNGPLIDHGSSVGPGFAVQLQAAALQSVADGLRSRPMQRVVANVQAWNAAQTIDWGKFGPMPDAEEGFGGVLRAT